MTSPFSFGNQGTPQTYWADRDLKLARGSNDGQIRLGKPKKPPFVRDMQRDLIALGYLTKGADDGSFGAGTERAVTRFQRHARQSLRMLARVPLCVQPWTGSVTGICNAATAKEIRLWLARGYRLPFDIHRIVKIDGGRLREDVATAWNAALADAPKKGATLISVTAPLLERYSDTTRPTSGGYKNTGGNSKRSLHYTGRAVDLTQDLNGGKGARWWIVKEDVNGKTYWRIYCKTDKQDGTQGSKIAAKSVKHYVFWHHTGEEFMPEGYYLDLTAFLETHGFTRIPAHKGWETVEKKREWWHFHYTYGLRDTFQDEMELIGVGEAELRRAGWTTADLDARPG